MDCIISVVLFVAVTICLVRGVTGGVKNDLDAGLPLRTFLER